MILKLIILAAGILLWKNRTILFSKAKKIINREKALHSISKFDRLHCEAVTTNLDSSIIQDFQQKIYSIIINNKEYFYSHERLYRLRRAFVGEYSHASYKWLKPASDSAFHMNPSIKNIIKQWQDELNAFDKKAKQEKLMTQINRVLRN